MASDEPAPSGAGRRFTVRVVRGAAWVDGLAPPVAGAREGWQGEGAFDLPASIGERMWSLDVDVDGAKRGTANFVTYRAVFVSLHGGEG